MGLPRLFIELRRPPRPSPLLVENHVFLEQAGDTLDEKGQALREMIGQFQN